MKINFCQTSLTLKNQSSQSPSSNFSQTRFSWNFALTRSSWNSALTRSSWNSASIRSCVYSISTLSSWNSTLTHSCVNSALTNFYGKRAHRHPFLPLFPVQSLAQQAPRNPPWRIRPSSQPLQSPIRLTLIQAFPPRQTLFLPPQILPRQKVLFLPQALLQTLFTVPPQLLPTLISSLTFIPLSALFLTRILGRGGRGLRKI